MSITLIIIALTVGASLYAWNNQGVFNRLLFIPSMVRDRNQYDRFLTSGFIHLDWAHLFFNMLALYFFGDFVENIFANVFGSSGWVIFIIFYLSAIIVSEIPSYLQNRENSYYKSLGASGGVAAIIFVNILYYPSGTIYLYFIPLPSILVGILYLIYSVQMSKRMDGVNHLAHLSGSIYGVVFATVSNPDVIQIFMNQLKDLTLF